MQLGAATEVGDVSCNLKLNPLKGGLSSVRGDVETRNLRLGELLDRRDLLGNATLTAYVDGVIGKGNGRRQRRGQRHAAGVQWLCLRLAAARRPPAQPRVRRTHHGPRSQPRLRLLRHGRPERLRAALRLYDGPAARRPGPAARQPPRLGVAAFGPHRRCRRRAFARRPERPHPGDRRPLPLQRQRRSRPPA